MRKLRAIGADEVPDVFDDDCVCRLAGLIKLPSNIDLGRFGESVRNAALRYAQQAVTPSRNELHRELKELHRLASKPSNYEALAQKVEIMTPAARDLLNERFANMPDWRIPTATELSDPAASGAAVDGLLALLEVGGRWVEGRTRALGRRSTTWRPKLHAPEPNRAEPRRAAEREFVMWLQIAVAEAGTRVPRTANQRHPGPFARMVAEALCLIKAAGPATARGLAVQLINDLETERRDVNLSPMNS